MGDALRQWAPPGVRPRRRLGRWTVAVLLSAALMGLGVGVLALTGEAYRTLPVPPSPPSGADDESRLAHLQRRLESLRPGGAYVVVDSHRNRLRVVQGDEVLREAVCSTGTRTALRDPRDGRIWVFDTPVGERRVRRKVRDPVWVKPDWAFLEEGKLPPEDFRKRYDDVSLGDFALYLGDGYIIHGTLFQSLLGSPATHGCIRLGDDDLEYVYRQLPVGARVYLY